MKGDFTRLTFRPDNQYSSVRMQQGRVQLDADWNEQMDIQAYQQQAVTAAFIGANGTPTASDGFAISADGADLRIKAGIFFVDGMICETRDTTYKTQPDLPDGEKNVNPTAGQHLVYLDVTSRHVTALEDPRLREPAISGPDTTTRIKTTWQVRLAPGEALPQNPSPDTQLKLQARLKPTSSPGGYLGLENQLYRVEVHKGGTLPVSQANPVTFKWSRENGSIVAAWDGQSGNELTISNPGRSDDLGFTPGHWIELSDDNRELLGQPGILVQLLKVEGRTLTIDASSIPTGVTINRANFQRNPKVRSWDMVSGALTVLNGTWLDIENGIQIKFSGMTCRTGDYWLLPARTAKRDIEWPRDSDDQPIAQGPLGIEHHYAPLALVEWNGSAFTTVTNRRYLFQPLVQLAGFNEDTFKGWIQAHNHSNKPGDSPQIETTGIKDGAIDGSKIDSKAVVTIQKLNVDGHVGIGPTMPATGAKLDVNGNVNVTGTLTGRLRPLVQKFVVEGDGDKFYPVIFQDEGTDEGPLELEICRTSIYESYGRSKKVTWGSTLCTIRFHSSCWGNGSQFCKGEVYWDYQPLVAGWQSTYYFPLLVVWLRGGGTTYWWRSNHLASLLPSRTEEKLTQEKLPVLVVTPDKYELIDGEGTKRNDFPIKPAVDDYVALTEKGGLAVSGVGYFEKNVAIGTTTPAANTKLDVNGNVNVSGTLTATQGIAAQGGLTISDGKTLNATGPVNIGTTVANAKLDVNGNVNVSGKLTATQSIEANGGLNVSGLVAIGTTTPKAGAKLHVSGPIWADGTIGNLGEGDGIGQQMERGDKGQTTLRFDSDRWVMWAPGAGNILTVDTGRVGITMPSTGAKLDVNGNVNVSGNLTANGTVNLGTTTATSLNVTGTLNVTGALTAPGGIEAKVGLTSHGTTWVNTLYAAESINANGGLTVADNKTLTANGTVTLGSTTAASLDVTGNLNVTGTLTNAKLTALEAQVTALQSSALAVKYLWGGLPSSLPITIHVTIPRSSSDAKLLIWGSALVEVTAAQGVAIVRVYLTDPATGTESDCGWLLQYASSPDVLTIFMPAYLSLGGLSANRDYTLSIRAYPPTTIKTIHSFFSAVLFY